MTPSRSTHDECGLEFKCVKSTLVTSGELHLTSKMSMFSKLTRVKIDSDKHEAELKSTQIVFLKREIMGGG